MTLQPSVTCAVGEDVAGRADHDAGAVFDLALGRRTDLQRCRRRRGTRVNALDIATTTGSMMGSVAWSYSTVMPRTSPSLISART